MMKSALLTIFLVVFIDLLGFGIVIPILPYYAQTYGATGFEIGWLMTAYSLMQFLVAPLWGTLSDRIGRRPVLMISIFGTCCSLIFLGFAHSLEMLFIGRILAGIFAANISTAYAYISDVTTEENRAKGMGLIGASFGLGFIFGPAIGGVLSKYGYSFPMFFAAGLSILNLIFATLYLKEPPISAELRSANRIRRFSVENIKKAFASPITRATITGFFLLTFAITQMEVVYAIYMKATYGFDAQKAGLLLGLTGSLMVVIQGGLIGKLSRKFGERRLILTGSLLCGFSLLVYGMTQNLTLAVFALSFMAIGHGILHPSLSSLTSKGAAAENRGLVMGVFHSASSFARVIGPISAGWIYDHYGKNTPFTFAAAILGILFLFMFTQSSSVEKTMS